MQFLENVFHVTIIKKYTFVVFVSEESEEEIGHFSNIVSHLFAQHRNNIPLQTNQLTIPIFDNSRSQHFFRCNSFRLKHHNQIYRYHSNEHGKEYHCANMLPLSKVSEKNVNERRYSSRTPLAAAATLIEGTRVEVESKLESFLLQFTKQLIKIKLETLY